MKEITATEAARNFSNVLDAVEHRNESFLVKRGGQPVARIGPATPSSGATLKKILVAFEPDPSWAKELEALRAQLKGEDRLWSG